MRQAISTSAAIAALVLATAPGVAQTESHVAAALELMDVTDARGMTEQSMRAARDLLLADSVQAEALADYMDVIDEFLLEQFRWEVFEPDMIRLYVEVFTEAELRDLTAFYRTDLGRMMLERLPIVMQRSMEITQARLQTALPQLLERLQAAMMKRGPSR